MSNVFFVPVILLPFPVVQQQEQEKRKINPEREVEKRKHIFPLLNEKFPGGVCLQGVLLSFPVCLTQNFLKSPSGKMLSEKIERMVMHRFFGLSLEQAYRFIDQMLFLGTCKGQSIVRAFVECMHRQDKTIAQEKILEYVIFFQTRTYLQRQLQFVSLQEGKALSALKAKRELIKKELEIVDLVERALFRRPLYSNMGLCQLGGDLSGGEVDELATSFEKMCVLSEGVATQRDRLLVEPTVFAQDFKMQEHTIQDSKIQKLNVQNIKVQPPTKDLSSVSPLLIYDFQQERMKLIEKRKNYLKALKQVKEAIVFHHSNQQEAIKIRQDLIEYAKKIMLECNSGHVGHSAFNREKSHKEYVTAIIGEIGKLVQKNEVEATLLKLFHFSVGGHAILVLPKEKQIFDIQHGTMSYTSLSTLLQDLEHYLLVSQQYSKVYLHSFGEFSKGAQLIPV